VANLVPALLSSCEPLHKLCQPSRKWSLNRSVGQPQPLSKLLKVTGTRRLAWNGVGSTRERNCRGVTLEQGLLHRDTLAGGTDGR
jgi:hypothetical protein